MRTVILILGILLLLLGLTSMVTPIPGGTIMIATSLGMIICSSKRAELFLRQNRANRAWLNAALSWIENKLGERLSAPLRRTRPAVEDQND